jgi:hypothetical protein
MTKRKLSGVFVRFSCAASCVAYSSLKFYLPSEMSSLDGMADSFAGWPHQQEMIFCGLKLAKDKIRFPSLPFKSLLLELIYR